MEHYLKKAKQMLGLFQEVEIKQKLTRDLLLERWARSRINAAVSPHPNHLGKNDNLHMVFAAHEDP